MMGSFIFSKHFRIALGACMIVTWIFECVMNGLSNLALWGPTNSQISNSHPVVLVPAGTAFSIWGLIFLLQGVFAIMYFVSAFSLSDRSHAPKASITVGFLFCINAVLNGIWGVVFSQLNFPGAAVILLLLFLTNVAMMAIAAWVACTDPQAYPVAHLIRTLITPPIPTPKTVPAAGTHGESPSTPQPLTRLQAVRQLAARFVSSSWVGVYTGWTAMASLLNWMIVWKYTVRGAAEFHAAANVAPPVISSELDVATGLIIFGVVLGSALAASCGSPSVILTVAWATWWIVQRASKMADLCANSMHSATDNATYTPTPGVHCSAHDKSSYSSIGTTAYGCCLAALVLGLILVAFHVLLRRKHPLVANFPQSSPSGLYSSNRGLPLKPGSYDAEAEYEGVQ